MWIFAWLVACEPWSAVVQAVRFPIEGAHLDLTCDRCHIGPPPYDSLVYRKCVGVGALLDVCLDCHSCDRELHPRGEEHFPGRSCGEAGCHSGADLTWADVVGGPPTPTDTGDPTVPIEDSCAGNCHGEVWSDASPRDSSHEAHQIGHSLWAGEIDCSGCHPASGGDVSLAASHADGATDVALSGLALGPVGALVASYDGASCSVYCHGSSMAEPPDDPLWNGGPSEVQCGSCHGWPPLGEHPSFTGCSGCHPPTGGDDGTIWDLASHIDGDLQLD